MARLYYTDITKVLYLMKNFGIEFEAQVDEEFGDLADFGDFGCEHESISDFLNSQNSYPEKIYVKKEFESFFRNENPVGLQAGVWSYNVFAPEVEND